MSTACRPRCRPRARPRDGPQVPPLLSEPDQFILGHIIAANAAAEILDALRGYFWIALVAVVLWLLFPIIKRRLESEDFTVEAAGMKVTFENASAQLRRELDDLREQVISLVERAEEPEEGTSGRSSRSARSGRR